MLRKQMEAPHILMLSIPPSSFARKMTQQPHAAVSQEKQRVLREISKCGPELGIKIDFRVKKSESHHLVIIFGE